MDIDEKHPIVAFTLARYPGSASIAALSHLGIDRLPLSRMPGLRFWRLLGVGQGRVFSPQPDFQRYALLTVWDSLDALRRFEAQSTVMRRIYARSEEAWTVHMYPVRWHGLWGGCDPMADIVPVAPPDPGPWIILTRAKLRLAHVKAFLDAVPNVAEHLLQQPGLLNSVGVGEAPLLYQATLSVWQTLPDITTFAYGSNAHREVVQRTRSEAWYREELFARFRPIASFGTWDGWNPLARL